MEQPLQPGELVVQRVRWKHDADLMGIIVGHNNTGRWDEWLVMWTTGDCRVEFNWHLADALMVVIDKNLEKIRRRCAQST